MITYYKPVSWSRIKEALECPKKLQFFIDKTPPRYDDTYYMAAGMVVQRAFELYYSKGIYKIKSRQSAETLLEIAKRLVEAKWAEVELKANLTFKQDRTPVSYWKRIETGIIGGWKVLAEENLVGTPLLVETMWRGKHEKLNIFAKIDFLEGPQTEDKVVRLYDGKLSTHKQDLNQLLFYTLVLKSCGYRVKELAFIYYLTGKLDRIASTEMGVNALLDNFLITPEWQRASKIFNALKMGVKELPATPERRLCQICQYRYTCQSWQIPETRQFDGFKVDNESRLSEIDRFATLSGDSISISD